MASSLKSFGSRGRRQLAALYIQLGKAQYKNTDVKTRQLTNPKISLLNKGQFQQLVGKFNNFYIFYHCYLLSF
jgi:hypothetical protein